ncbi:chloride channel protein [Denitromonas iodatirespirans]|uniref:Chloride channel protein n=1 Tax=Denitromonas iodatirespirans TaxID=2795389 RepID=A0A944DFZ5_DENI1|nr:chloride channel protein [Denitromonas iodatirespirans]MBT0963643.1 chloride channel protein [Denitromonas iodatirespirans]
MPWLSFGRWQNRLLLVSVTLLAGLAAIVFAIGADLAIEIHRETVHLAWWSSLFIAPAGFALICWLTRRFFPGCEGSGIPQAIAASLTEDSAIRNRLLSVRNIFGKIVLTLIGLLSGASIGREGPTVQVGASILNLISGKRKNGRIAPTRDLIVAGGGAGVASAFNTPLGGIMFAIEELSRYRAFRANSTTLVAVIFAGLMSLATLGNYTYFGRTPAAVGWPDGLWPVLLCGVLGGLAGGISTRLLIASSRGLPGRMGQFKRERPVAFAAACGLATAIIGLSTGGMTWGTGYAESKAALEGTADLPVYFMFAKALVIWIAFISGIPGGIFAPALAIGAGLGANVALMLGIDHNPAILVLGTVAFLAGITQSPITSFVIVMEMTANHQMLMPLMGAAVVAQGFSRSVAPVPLYDALAIDMLKRLTHEEKERKGGGASSDIEPETVSADPAPPPGSAEDAPRAADSPRPT